MAMNKPKRRFRRRVKVCRFTVEKINYIDYKDIDLLREYVHAHQRQDPAAACDRYPARIPAQADTSYQTRAFHGSDAVRRTVD